MITMTYAGMVFAAMETDYYPHLSAVCHDTEKMNGAVNRQIEVSLMLIAPMLVALMFGLKVLIPLLFSGKFLPVIGMTQIAVLAMYSRALSLPVSISSRQREIPSPISSWRQCMTFLSLSLWCSVTPVGDWKAQVLPALSHPSCIAFA